MSSLARALLVAARPRQWVKNLFVAAPLVFARKATDPSLALEAICAVAAFCALSSAVYLVNDVVDVEKDRAHPVKRHRPIPAGQLTTRAALTAAALLALLALTAATLLTPAFGLVAAGYLALNLAYSLRIKAIPFLDVGSIALGFILRVLGGALAIGVPHTPWLLACTGLLAAFLGLGKRAHELAQARAADGPLGPTRTALERYHPRVLRGALLGVGAATAIAYLAYTQAEHTVTFFGTTGLIFTVPCCFAGIARFLVLVDRPRGESPTEEMLRDWPFMANLALFAAVVLVVIYRR
ncbi:MAG: decaprenyl-phosphate phosphoribosyltransferase [Myxococcales bacterium]|nr:decaprenyl-phosphate phosphoribosyltransferase [Myxococcales bacterium]